MLSHISPTVYQRNGRDFLELIDIYHKKSLTEWTRCLSEIIVRWNQMKWGWVNVGIIPNVGTIPLSKGSGVVV